MTEYARVPVLKHLDGVCHVYVDAAADLEMAVNVLDDAKTQRPGVCNAAETLLVDAAAAERFLPMAAERMRLRGVECRVCDRSRPFFGPEAIPAEEEDWSTEYEDLILSVKVVDGVVMPWSTLTITAPTTVIPSLRRMNGRAIIL